MESSTRTPPSPVLKGMHSSARGENESATSGTHKKLTETSEEKFGLSNITVSNARGYLCHIVSEAILPCSPKVLFAILCNPDNSPVFRDLKARGDRKVIEDRPEGYKVIEIEQIGEIKVLWKYHSFSTLLSVTEDSRGGNYKTSFKLIKSDVLSKFQGTWTLQPEPSSGGNALSTRAILEQDVLPVGVPPFMKHLPLLGPVLRAVCVRAVRRLLEDLEAVIAKLQAGIPLEQILRPPKKSSKSSAARSGTRIKAHPLELSDSDHIGQVAAKK